MSKRSRRSKSTPPPQSKTRTAPPANAEIVDPLDVQRIEIERMVGVAGGTNFSGPIPSPEMLARYDELLPGSAARLIAMAEDEAKHRRDIESKVLNANIDQKTRNHDYRMRGQFFGFAIAMCAIVGGVLLGKSGVQGWGTLLGLGGVATLVIPFIVGNMYKSKD